MRWLLWLLLSSVAVAQYIATVPATNTSVSTPTLLHGSSGACATGTTCAVNMTSTTTGSFLVCGFIGDTTPTVSVSDNKSQNYTAASGPTSINGGNNNVTLFLFPNTASGVTTITATSNASNHGMMSCGEFTGMPTTNTFDQAGAFGSITASTWTSAATGTLAQANELIIGLGFCNSTNNCAFAAGSGFALVGTHSGNSGSGIDSMMEWKTVNATTAVTASGSQTGSAQGGVYAIKGN